MRHVVASNLATITAEHAHRLAAVTASMVDSDEEASPEGPTYPPCDLCGEACEGNQELCVPWLPGRRVAVEGT